MNELSEEEMFLVKQNFELIQKGLLSFDFDKMRKSKAGYQPKYSTIMANRLNDDYNRENNEGYLLYGINFPNLSSIKTIQDIPEFEGYNTRERYESFRRLINHFSTIITDLENPYTRLKKWK